MNVIDKTAMWTYPFSKFHEVTLPLGSHAEASTERPWFDNSLQRPTWVINGLACEVDGEA